MSNVFDPIDWNAMLRLDRRIKWALAGAVLPLLALTAEMPFLWADFHASGFELYGVMCFTTGFVVARELLFKLFSPLFYLCFVVYQYDFFFNPTQTWADPAQSRFWLAAIFALVCFGCNVGHGMLAARARRLGLPEPLSERVGRPFGGARLRREMAVAQAAAEAQANQAWVAQAGRQE